MSDPKPQPEPFAPPSAPPPPEEAPRADREGEIGGPQGAEPARYGDWERNGRCSDF